MEAEKCKYCKQ